MRFSLPNQLSSSAEGRSCIESSFLPPPAHHCTDPDANTTKKKTPKRLISPETKKTFLHRTRRVSTWEKKNAEKKGVAHDQYSQTIKVISKFHTSRINERTFISWGGDLDQFRCAIDSKKKKKKKKKA